MSKKGVSSVSGITNPLVGEKQIYNIVSWYPATSESERNPAQVTWELFKKRKDGAFTTTNIKKTGHSDFTFGEASLGHTYRLEAYLYKPEGGGLIITPKAAKIPKINKIELLYIDDTKGMIFSFMERLKARAYCVNMIGKELNFTLWEDDAKGAGHNSKNLPVASLKGRVDKDGLAAVDFSLSSLLFKAAQGEQDSKLEFYVTVEYFKDKKHASNNVDVNNPYPKVPVNPSKKTEPKKAPVAKDSPAESKGNSKKEEKGIWDSFTESVSKKGGELWDWAESIGTAVKDKLPTFPMPDGKSPVVVKKQPKEKFDKVVGNGKEAILYISSEIATEIKLDKTGKMTSYPDHGGSNGQDEYKEGDKIYCKKISKTSTAFPLYKMYIYRGNKVGEAVKKLEQDIENKTHENAESTVLTVARHAQTNNKNYGQSGPVPPNTIQTLYRIRYKKASNHAGKESFRYRIVDDNASNMVSVKDISKEVSSGAMTLGKRGSISLDPWKSKDLIGCVGIRNSDGSNHPSCAAEMSDLSAANYKFVYHSLNNYLETVLPELKGVYGRRGYSSNGKVAVAASDFKEEVKVFVLVDALPEINECNCNLEERRKKYYGSFGEKTVKYISEHSTANKFKGLYMVAQRRQENGFSINTPLNNPMNIKGTGDDGKEVLSTHETYDGKYQAVKDSFAKFTSEDAGFDGYMSLLKRNFPHAYSAVTTDSMTIDDFVVGLEDMGLKGAYATGEAKNGISGTEQYKTAVKNNFNSVIKDYKKWLECKKCATKDAEAKKKLDEDIKLLNQLK